MKKPTKSYIDFTIKIAKCNKTIKLCLLNTTNLEQISNTLCKKLKLNKHFTKIRYSKFEFPHPIYGKHTLRQIGMANGGVLMADIRSSCEPSSYETGVAYSHDVSIVPTVKGWSHKYEDVHDTLKHKVPISTKMHRGDPLHARKVANQIKKIKKHAWEYDIVQMDIPKSKLENIEMKLQNGLNVVAVCLHVLPKVRKETGMYKNR